MNSSGTHSQLDETIEALSAATGLPKSQVELQLSMFVIGEASRFDWDSLFFYELPRWQRFCFWFRYFWLDKTWF